MPSLLLSGALLMATRAAVAADAPPPAGTIVRETLDADIERLKVQASAQPNNATLVRQLALAYNTKGVGLAHQRRWPSAIEQFKQALIWLPYDARIQQNLVDTMVGSAYELYQTRKTQQAKTLLDQALRYTTPSYDGLVLAGQMAYDAQQLKEAEGYWQKALKLQPDAEDVKTRLTQLKRERTVEDQFDQLRQQSFDLRFDASLPQEDAQLRTHLEEVRRTVGQAFHYFPTHKIVVLVYTEEQFRALRGDNPEWVAGQYDGKIRIPIKSRDPQVFRRILWHEYTHALVHDLSLDHCPTWLNEGLAEYQGSTQQRRPLTALRAAYQATPRRLLSLPALSIAFGQAASAEEAALAYEQAFSLVEYLVDRYGLWRLTRVLKRLGAGEGFDTAFRAEIYITPDMAYQRWVTALPLLLSAPAS